MKISAGEYCLRILLRKTHALPKALRPIKTKSTRKEPIFFVDSKQVNVIGGKGGDGCISFLQVWCNERAGPDGGDGGNGGHVIFQSTTDVRNFNHILSTLRGVSGENGSSENCHGKNAQHTIVKVPIGTVVRNKLGCVVGDLSEVNLMFVAARGGVGGKGNRFFATAVQKSPKICEYGPQGEEATYILELRTMADVGFIGHPNAGKSSLLNAITRAKPKVAPYPFTTLRPYVGMVQYEDFTQLTVADLPGLIPGSHLNRGLGIQFLKHAERCKVLLIVLDASLEESHLHYEQLLHELRQFSPTLAERPKIVVANKMDLPEAKENYLDLQKKLAMKLIPISAKTGENLCQLLSIIREYYERHKPNKLRNDL
ncbi:PREDICTED: mitochondrial ribosome-associated GTPase 2 isoform X2 [Rhagoletis zephyria]|uniref:mitochondrial ribosome-associated GTPase 2 isoform X2 n=1 Tax=Rhagoletis zephyria TaxID=28612 RepID=UPI00081151D7|nr:PREDICTED: mitochondrial ribosome-associated GTPase 2 isoform X2 [Rhagoletis zephyria]